MFIFTAKFDKRKAIAIIVVLAALITGVFLVAGSLNRDAAEKAEKPILSTNLKTNENRVAYLNQLGWEVDPEPLESQEIVIPREFTGVYEDYVKLQDEQGFSLSKYGGMNATRYTYKVNNYPSGEKNIVADIIVFGTTLIAGDIQCPALNGFMHGLDGP